MGAMGWGFAIEMTWPDASGNGRIAGPSFTIGMRFPRESVNGRIWNPRTGFPMGMNCPFASGNGRMRAAPAERDSGMAASARDTTARVASVCSTERPGWSA